MTIFRKADLDIDDADLLECIESLNWLMASREIEWALPGVLERSLSDWADKARDEIRAELKQRKQPDGLAPVRPSRNEPTHRV